MLFWDVDTQVDFLLPGGRLYVPGAEVIIPNLARLTSYAREKRFPLISSACAHVPGDPELLTYGPHCMVGTLGQRKVMETLLPNRFTVPNHRIQLPSAKACQQLIIEKQAFDVFTNPNTDKLLKQFGPALQILLYGVVTEICVASAARRLLERGHKVALVGDAVRAIDAHKAVAVMEDLLRAGGQVITTEDATTEELPLAA